uniref:Uncharacterized protein n=1 Tax=Cacopsylla melanoneura TaxID=428564 RepID=A0A8D9FCT9_9HEMI
MYDNLLTYIQFVTRLMNLIYPFGVMKLIIVHYNHIYIVQELLYYAKRFRSYSSTLNGSMINKRFIRIPIAAFATLMMISRSLCTLCKYVQKSVKNNSYLMCIRGRSYRRYLQPIWLTKVWLPASVAER